MAPAKADSQHRSTGSSALGLRFLMLAALSIVLLVVDHRNNHLDVVRKAIGAAVYPLRVVVDAPVTLWRWIDQTTASRNELQLENSRLHAERLITQARLQRYAALEAAIREGHPAELPEIIAVPIECGLAAYLEWVGSETTP